jgi:hypothetical protein
MNKVYVQERPEGLNAYGLRNYERIPASEGGKPISRDLWEAYSNVWNALVALDQVVAEQVGNRS